MWLKLNRIQKSVSLSDLWSGWIFFSSRFKLQTKPLQFGAHVYLPISANNYILRIKHSNEAFVWTLLAFCHFFCICISRKCIFQESLEFFLPKTFLRPMVRLKNDDVYFFCSFFLLVMLKERFCQLKKIICM